MSGHSKWHNIQKTKGAADAKRAQAFTKIAREMIVAVKEGGYGPNGVAIIVEAMTDNRKRTASEVRHFFDKYGGNMGAEGCVSWSFDRKGVIVIDNEDEDLDEDTVMMDVLDAGGDDLKTEGQAFIVYTDPDSFPAVSGALEEKKYKFLSAQVEMVPQNYVSLTDPDDIKNMTKMLDMFDDNEDVENVFHNCDNLDD